MMIVTSKFDLLLTEVGQLTLDEQQEFVNILKRRMIEQRRAEILAEIQEVRKEFAEGKAVVTNVAELMRELEQ